MIGSRISVGRVAITAADDGLRQAQTSLLELKGRLHAVLSSGRRLNADFLACLQERLRDAAVATGDADCNLLIIARTDQTTFLAGPALTRGLKGEISLRPIEVNRAKTALFDHDPLGCERRGIVDRPCAISGLAVAALDGERLARGDTTYVSGAARRVEAALADIKAALSYLSIARSRLDLQAIFIASLSAASSDQSAPAPGEALDGSALRQVAFETKRLLSEHSRSIANLNRETVLRLFQDD